MIDLLLNLDTYLAAAVQSYGLWIYVMVFIVIFCETGLVIMPFLPGDSLIFLLGAFAAQGLIDLPLIFGIIVVAAFIGDTVNYHMGKMIGAKVFSSDTSRIFKKKYLTQTQEFYEKHGKKTIVLARFVPIIRTFAPFVAGIGHMPYRDFLGYNAVGALLWATIFLVTGYTFGNLPVIRDNVTVLTLGIIALSLLPAPIHYLHNRLKNR